MKHFSIIYTIWCVASLILNGCNKVDSDEKLSITLDSGHNCVIVTSGQTVTVGYSLSNKNATLSARASVDSYIVEVKQESNNSGKILISVPAATRDCEIEIYAIDKNGSSDSAFINCYAGDIGDVKDYGSPSGNREDYYIDENGINRGKGISIRQKVGTEEKIVIWAPVNLGSDNISRSGGKNYPYGKLYQWGRKVGHGYGAVVEYYSGNLEGEPYTVIDEAGEEISIRHTSAYQKDILAKPDNKTFYIGNSNTRDWYAGDKSTLINSEWNEINKTQFIGNPCPDGWRVPTGYELNGLIENHSSWSARNGQNGYYFKGAEAALSNEESVFFPASGYRIGDKGETFDRELSGRYWSSGNGTIGAYYISFGPKGVTLYDEPRANGMSVRCVKE